MNDYLKTLNKKQREAVTTESQHVRVIAGAGSGKTRVLTTRIAYIIETWGVTPSSILAITFTNKAASEMKTRVEAMIPPSNTSVHVSTIHSFCVGVLRQEIRREGYPSNFTILDTDDQKSIIKEGCKVLDISSKDYNANLVLDHIANCKTAGISPEKDMEMTNSIRGENLARLYQYYTDRCHELYGLDFDDLLLWTVRIFKKYPDARKKWQDRYHFILVDEYQDIDNVQDELITLLTAKDTYLYVVGDPDQTIYSWRGANINIIMQFDKVYPDSETIILEQNYRSTQMILNGANSLIQANKNRVKKDLFTENEEGSKITQFTASSDENEATYVVSKINKLNNKGTSYKDIAVLYRSAYLSRMLEKELIDFRIPYIIYGGIRFFERAEVKDMISYLKLIAIDDDLAFKRIVNVPKRAIGEKSIDSLFDFARANHTQLIKAIDDFDTTARLKKKLVEFKEMILSFRERSQSMTLEQTFQMVFEESGYRDMLENSDDPKADERLENVKELLNDVASYQFLHPDLTLEDYLDYVALYSDRQNDINDQYVTLMTIHAAKGLEFDNVFVIGMSEGIFPSQRTIEESGRLGLEEERRLAYVAFTRARKNLWLTDNSGFSYTTSSSKNTSRFVSEIDDEYIQRGSVTLVSTEKQESDVSGYFKVPTGKAANKYSAGDTVVHEVFGEGIVLNVDNGKGVVTVAFRYPYNTKTLAIGFPKMHKVVS